MGLIKPNKANFVRHEILKQLFKESQNESDYQNPKNRLSLTEISEKTKINFDDILFYHELLHEIKDVNCQRDTCENDSEHRLLITNEGRQKYINEYYLKKGIEEARTTLKDNVSIFAPITSVLISLLAVFIAYMNFNKSGSKPVNRNIIHVHTFKNKCK